VLLRIVCLDQFLGIATSIGHLWIIPRGAIYMTFKLYRLQEKARTIAALKADGSILIAGEEGSGKSILIAAIAGELAEEGFNIAFVDTPSTTKENLLSIADQLEIDTVDLEGKNLTVDRLKIAIRDYLNDNPATFLVFDDAHQLDAKFRTWLKALRRNGASMLIAATNPPRSDVFLNTPALILKPLPDYQIRDLMQAAGADRGINLTDSQIANLQQRSGGNPALAVKSIDEEYLGLDVEVGDRADYFDVTPLLILIGTAFVMLRFFAIGTDNRMLYVFAGMSGALLLGLSYMIRSLPKDSRRVN
jgi:energy-coupling factor transporter ATP-binding protein EcfA2